MRGVKLDDRFTNAIIEAVLEKDCFEDVTSDITSNLAYKSLTGNLVYKSLTGRQLVSAIGKTSYRLSIDEEEWLLQNARAGLILFIDRYGNVEIFPCRTRKELQNMWQRIYREINY